MERDGKKQLKWKLLLCAEREYEKSDTLPSRKLLCTALRVFVLVCMSRASKLALCASVRCVCTYVFVRVCTLLQKRQNPEASLDSGKQWKTQSAA